MSNVLKESIVCAILSLWFLLSLVQGQTTILSGTNYGSGSGFCFGDQQLKEGTPFISCTASGFTGHVAAYTVLWSIDGSVLSEGQVEGMYPGHIDAETPRAGEFRLNIINVTSLGVSPVACRISAFNSGGGFVGQTQLSIPESISVVSTVPAPKMPRVTPSYTSVEVTVSKPSGLCEGLRSGQITYEFKVYRSNSLVTTENVTTSGPTATATLSGLSGATEYRVEIRGIINVISQSMPVSGIFYTSSFGRTAILSGTNFVSGGGFCFGDQQLKEGTPFISCTASGFPGNVDAYTVSWSIDGSVLSEGQVEGMYPVEAVTPQAGEYRLNILNVTSLGVSSVACRIAGFNSAGNLVGQTPLSMQESFYVVNVVPAPEMPRVTPSYPSAEIAVSKPSGLCEGLRSSQITYEFKVYRSNSLVITENVTTSGPTATATLSGLNISTEYRVEIRGIIDVVSQNMPISVTFNTLPDVNEYESDDSEP